MTSLIRKWVKKINSQDGSLVFLIATLAFWLFVIGFSVDFFRILAVRRYFTIQFDHALKAASKQLDEDKLADRVIYIMPDKAEEMFSTVFKGGVSLEGDFPIYRPGYDRGYSGDIEVLDFEVLNGPPVVDSLKTSLIFDNPTVHGVVQIPMETVIWKYFGVDEMIIRIHCDASTEILDPDRE